MQPSCVRSQQLTLWDRPGQPIAPSTHVPLVNEECGIVLGFVGCPMALSPVCICPRVSLFNGSLLLRATLRGTKKCWLISSTYHSAFQVANPSCSLLPFVTLCLSSRRPSWPSHFALHAIPLPIDVLLPCMPVMIASHYSSFIHGLASF